MKAWTKETTRKWLVLNMTGDTVHEVEAAYASIREAGTLVFHVLPDPTAATEVVRAFAPGYWSQMQMVEIAESPASPNESEGVKEV